MANHQLADELVFKKSWSLWLIRIFLFLAGLEWIRIAIQYAQERQIHEDDILPRMEEWKAHAQTAVAAAKTAQQQGVARLSASEATLYSQAVKTIRAARDATQMLIREGFIPKPPEV